MEVGKLVNVCVCVCVCVCVYKLAKDSEAINYAPPKYFCGLQNTDLYFCLTYQFKLSTSDWWEGLLRSSPGS